MSKYSSEKIVSNIISDINITFEMNLYKEIYDPYLIRFEAVMLLAETNYQKLNTYASQAVDPQIKQIFTKSAQDALNTKQKLMEFLEQ